MSKVALAFAAYIEVFPKNGDYWAALLMLGAGAIFIFIVWTCVLYDEYEDALATTITFSISALIAVVGLFAPTLGFPPVLIKVSGILAFFTCFAVYYFIEARYSVNFDGSEPPNRASDRFGLLNPPDVTNRSIWPIRDESPN